MSPTLSRQELGDYLISALLVLSVALNADLWPPELSSRLLVHQHRAALITCIVTIG
jgi:hypothetical protein